MEKNEDVKKAIIMVREKMLSKGIKIKEVIELTALTKEEIEELNNK